MTTEVLTNEALAAMPDGELLHRLQRLRGNVGSLQAELDAFRADPYGRAPDWAIRVEERLRDWNAALTQAREEGARRLAAKRGGE